jgi:hypothetical protein
MWKQADKGKDVEMVDQQESKKKHRELFDKPKTQNVFYDSEYDDEDDDSEDQEDSDDAFEKNQFNQ